jgi:hypothetical protein
MATLGCVLIGLGLAACGGGSSGSKNESAAPPAAPPPSDVTPPPPAASGGITKPGTKLSLGETAHVTFKPLSAPVGSTKTYPLDVTVLKIERGSIDDFKNIDLDADQKKSTPFYVTVRVSNPGVDVPVKSDDPDIRFDGIDDRGQEQGSVTFIGEFDRCEDTSAPSPFSKGDSYESCLAYLMPGGGSIKQVDWSGSDEYVLKPVSWN